MDVGDYAREQAGLRGPKIRESKVAWLPIDVGIDTTPLFEKIFHCMNNININHFGYEGMEISESAQYTEYGVGDYYGWHTDSVPTGGRNADGRRSPVRKISMTLFM